MDQKKEEEIKPRFVVVQDSWYNEFIVKDLVRDYKVVIKDDKKSADDIVLILNYVNDHIYIYINNSLGGIFRLLRR